MGDPDDGRTGQLTIATHRKPHLDEVVASWLLRNFDPAFKDCAMMYVANTPTGGTVPTGENIVPLGIGRGKYDEHGLKAGMSATKLVYEDLLSRGLIPNDRYEDKALEWLVDYAHKEDTAQWSFGNGQDITFTIPPILRGVWLKNKGNDPDNAMMKFGWELIDGLMEQLNERAQFMADWDRRVEFESKWGKAVGLVSSYRGSDLEAYHRGFILRVQVDPKRPFGDFRGQSSSDVDLEPMYDILNKKEPDAWYLHQSHKILTASMDVKVGKTTSQTLDQLIELVKK